MGISGPNARRTDLKEVCLSKSDPIRLSSCLKLAGVVGSGGQAKVLIRSGQVLVNGVREIRPGRQLEVGDIVEAGQSDPFRLVIGQDGNQAD